VRLDCAHPTGWSTLCEGPAFSSQSELEPSDDLDDLLAEADPDPTGVFLG